MMVFRNVLLAVFVTVVAAASTESKEISERLTVSLDERIRLETWDNAITLEDTVNASVTYTRIRSRLGAVWSPTSHAALGLRLTNEFRYYLAPTTVDFSMHEIFVDHLYLRLTLPPALPMTITVGRQDIMQGEGFILLDGSPLDGSRSAYFNALRLDWNFQTDHNVTAFASYSEETDSWLPVIHEADQALIEQPERGLGLYYRGKWPRRDLQMYLVSLHRSVNANYPASSTTTSIGGRIEQRLLSSTDLTAVIESGLQFGKNADADRRAWGGYGYVRYRPDWKSPRSYLPVSLSTGLIYLSGDDPGTDRWEGWDPMFGRWPKWSESYIYAQIRENGVAWWTNLASVTVEAQFRLTTSAELKLTFHHLLAPRKSEISTGFPGGAGNTRGGLLIGKFQYTFDRCWSGHLLCERFDPGDYYFDAADTYLWLRAELMYKY